MADLWAIAFPILLVDVANPVLFAAAIFALTTDRPLANAFALILGHTITYFSFGVLILFGLADILDDLINLLENPQPGDFVISFLIGLALLWVAFRWRTDPPKTDSEAAQPKSSSTVGYLIFGAVVNLVGAPFALPYFAFVNELLINQNASVLPNLILYNVLYALPFALVPLSVALFGDAAMPVLRRVNQVIERVSGYVMPAILALLGLVLVVDAVMFWTTGTGLI